MVAQVRLQKILHKHLLEAQSKNPHYSLRSFSKKIGLSPGTTSEILRGRRKASKKLVNRIVKHLLLDPQEKYNLLKDFEKKQSVTAEQVRLTADQFHLISDWQHYAILSLMETSNFQSSTLWIAERLGLNEREIEKSLSLLERLSLIELDAKKKWRRTYASVHTTDDVMNMSLQKAHIADMEIAKNALQTLPVELRDFTSITMPTDPKLLKEAKMRIRRFRDEMHTFLSEQPGTEVYQISVHLFPLTRVKIPGEIS